MMTVEQSFIDDEGGVAWEPWADTWRREVVEQSRYSFVEGGYVLRKGTTPDGDASEG